MTGDTIESHLLGHSMFAIETTFTFVDEYTKTDRKLREQRPELTESERKAQVAEWSAIGFVDSDENHV